jgi:hypothetical protein
MIICPSHRFVFVHIPKCAGTSIRLQLRSCDDQHIFMGRTGQHPVLGTLDYAHIPLRHLHTHFPDAYQSLQDFDSFAMVRDPLERFGSALRQVLWQYEKRPMTLIPPQEVRDRTLEILDELAPCLDDPPHRFVFFTRQIDYVDDQGQRVVKNLIPITLTAELLTYFSHRSGVALDAGRHSNRNVDLRIKGGAGRLAYRVNAALRRSLPERAHARIKGAMLKVLARKTSAAQSSGLLDMAEVKHFVAHHYAADIDLFKKVMQREGDIKVGLAAGQLAQVT